MTSSSPRIYDLHAGISNGPVGLLVKYCNPVSTQTTHVSLVTLSPPCIWHLVVRRAIYSYPVCCTLFVFFWSWYCFRLVLRCLCCWRSALRLNYWCWYVGWFCGLLSTFVLASYLLEGGRVERGAQGEEDAPRGLRAGCHGQLAGGKEQMRRFLL